MVNIIAQYEILHNNIERLRAALSFTLGLKLINTLLTGWSFN